MLSMSTWILFLKMVDLLEFWFLKKIHKECDMFVNLEFFI